VLIMNIGNRILELRKAKKWSQSELSKRVGVSREIIGRYEREEVSPSFDIVQKIAKELDVSLDFLAGQGRNSNYDKKTLKLINDIEELEPSVKEKLLYLANAVIRDFKLRAVANS
jgi:transcriptional regulator with XRE-family HTH domain